MTVLRDTRAALTDGVLTIADAGRLLARHFPALLSVFLIGLACRNGVLWLAVLIGRDHGLIASFLIPLAPLSMVVALVVMLRIAGADLVAGGDRSRAARLAVLTSALIPFLTVYTVTGELATDRYQFVNESYADEFSSGGGLVRDLATRDIAVMSGHLQLYLLVGFLLVRLLIDVLDLEERHTAWGLVQVLVEVTWLTLFANYLTNQLTDLRGWAEDLVVLGWVREGWHEATGWLGPLTDPLRAVSALFSDTLDHLGPIVLTPVLWLAVGTVVIVGGLPERQRRRQVPGDSTGQVRARLELLRTGRVRGKVFELATRRFDDLVDAIRVLVHAGLLPVLTFCLVLPLARLAEWGAALVLRQLLGPGEPDTRIFFSTYADIVTRTAYTLVVVVLVVAAIDRLLVRRTEATAQPGQPSETSISV